MIEKLINGVRQVIRFIGLTTLALMALFITISVLSRLLHAPILGDVELVQLGMVTLIMCAIGYTQKVDGHIAIGLIVDKLPSSLQKYIDIFAYLLTIIATIIIAYVYVGVALKHKYDLKLSSDLLDVPFYFFDFIIVLGFTLWALETILKIIETLRDILQKESEVE